MPPVPAQSRGVEQYRDFMAHLFAVRGTRWSTRTAVRDRGPDVDVLASLRELALRLGRERHPLSGTVEGLVPFFRTVACSSALVARAREIGADLQATLAEELDRDPAAGSRGTLLAAFFVAGYATVLVENARRLIGGEPASAVAADHPARLEALFDALRHGVGQVG